MRESYPLVDGREVTRNFAGPGDGIGSLSDLLSGERRSRRKPTLASSLRGEADRNPAVAAFLTRTTYLLVAPVVLGRGLPIFSKPMDLELVELKQFPKGTVAHVYRSRTTK